MKIITELEAAEMEEVIKDAYDILVEEGYDFEAKDLKNVMFILARLQTKNIEECLEENQD